MYNIINIYNNILNIKYSSIKSLPGCNTENCFVLFKSHVYIRHNSLRFLFTIICKDYKFDSTKNTIMLNIYATAYF